MPTALGGVLLRQASAATKFDDAPEVDLPCVPDGGAILCVPTGTQAVDAASGLVTSRVVLVRLRLRPSGGMPPPELSRSLELQQTSAALARFRSTTPVCEVLPAIVGLHLRSFLDRLARDAGFFGGLADLLPRVAGLVDANRF